MSENGSDAVQPTEPKTITEEKKEMAERKIAKPKKKQNTKTKTTENIEPETKTDETKETTTRDDFTAGTSFSANQNTVNTSGTMFSTDHDNSVNTASNTNQTDSDNENHILRNIKVEPLDPEPESWTNGNIKMELVDPEYGDTPYNVTQGQMDTFDDNRFVNIKTEPTETEVPENQNEHSSYEYMPVVHNCTRTSNFPLRNIKIEPMDVGHDYQGAYSNMPSQCQSQYLHQYALPPQFMNQQLPPEFFPVELYYHQYLSNYHLQQALNYQLPIQTLDWSSGREVGPPSPPPALALYPLPNDNFADGVPQPLAEPQEGNLRSTRKRRTPSAAFGSAAAAAAAATATDASAAAAAATDTASATAVATDTPAAASTDTAVASAEIEKKKKKKQ